MALSRRDFLKGAGAAAGAATLSYFALKAWKGANGILPRSASRYDRVILIGIDGVDPGILDMLIGEGAAPNFARLRDSGAGGARGAVSTLQTVVPPQSPVVWCTLATGTNPGKHGVFDFIHRDPKRPLPFLSISRTGGGGVLRSPKYVKPRRNRAFWNVLSDYDVPVTALRWPVTFPPEDINGRMLSGLGVPSLRGTLGDYSLYTSDDSEYADVPSTRLTKVRAREGRIETSISGPRVRGVTGISDATIPMVIEWNGSGVTVTVADQSAALGPGEWSDWTRVKFPVGGRKTAAGIVKFHLIEREPVFKLYMTALEPDPLESPLALATPDGYAAELAGEIGTYHTLGMPEDTKALNEHVLSPAAFLQQCEEVTEERFSMFWNEFERFDEGLLAFVFDTSDRIQHMFWRENELDGDFKPTRLSPAIRDHYLTMDRFVGELLGKVRDRTALMVFSDHGFTSFDIAFDLNNWLVAEGFMTLTDDPARKKDAERTLYNLVDWSRTTAYGCGFSSVYLNLKDREGHGIVAPSEAEALGKEIAARLADYLDPGTGRKPVHRVYSRGDIYHGGELADAPDLVVGFRPGYGMNWQTAIGGVSSEILSPNDKQWSGGHIVDPSFVPGTILTNLPLDLTGATVADIAPTALTLLGVPPDPESDGRPLELKET